MNQRKLVLYIATSLDGYIATKKDNLDWLFQVEGEGDNGFSAFYDTVDTFLIGRSTYDWIMEHENGNFPYKGKECYVFSRTERPVNEYVTFIRDNIIDFVKDLKKKDGKDIWLVGGSDLLTIFMKEKMVDTYIINITPVLLGKGIPLFREIEVQTKLELTDIKRYNQFVELHYTGKGAINFSAITACGECCIGCQKKEEGICQGCIESDGNCKEWAQSGGCPIYKCAIKHNVPFCGLCPDFPCTWLTEKITWNPNIVEDLTKLADLYHNR